MRGLCCLLFPRGASLPCWLCTRRSGGGTRLLQQVLPQELFPLSWGCGRVPRHAGSGPNHRHMSVLGRRVLGNLRLSCTCWAPTESASRCAGLQTPARGPGSLSSPCGDESGRPSNRSRIPALAFPFPLTELSLLEPWQCACPWPLSPPQGRLGPRCKGKEGAELRPGRRQWCLPASRSLLLPALEA